MNLQFDAPRGARLFRTTSDEFFAADAAEVFGSTPVEHLAFVDGLHHWDQTLHDSPTPNGTAIRAGAC